MSVLPRPVTTAVTRLPTGWHVLRFNVLAGSRLAIVGANADLYAAWQSDFEGKTDGECWRLAAQANGGVWCFQDGQLIQVLQFGLMKPFPIAQPLSDGRWLITNARSHGEGNARLFREDGNLERRFELGDGIDHIKVDDRDRIWVGWFDEGIFGNEDWRLPGYDAPPSSAGIAAFDDRGALMHVSSSYTADCHALNVFGSEAWACTTHPDALWQMDKAAQQHTWPANTSGVRAIAVSYPYVLTAGGFGEDANRVVLLKLVGNATVTVGEWRLPFKVGFPSEVNLIDARGDELHIVQNQEWHRWRVSDFASACE